MNRIAIIPARSGSKGLKDKNIAMLCGKPLMAYTIEAALGSGCFDRTYVSSDSEEYLRIAASYGAEPLLRRTELAGDDVPTYEVVADILRNLESAPAEFALLQPTSPLRNAGHIKEAMELFDANKGSYDFVVSVCRADTPSVLIHPLAEDGSMKYFDINYSEYRRQDYEEYMPNGAIYIAGSKAYLEQGHFYGQRALAYKMNREASVDIDDAGDLALAEIYMR